VGYGDKYPVTAEGRALAIMLMMGGIGLFGTFTGYLATWFMEPRTNPEESMNITTELGALRAEVQQLRNEVVAANAVSSVRAEHLVPSLHIVSESDASGEGSTFLKQDS
jgi:hypothetical protein